MPTYYVKQTRGRMPVTNMSPVFPLSVHSSGRYQVDVSGSPWPILGLNWWSGIELPYPEQVAFVAYLVSMGFNHTEMWIPNGFSGTKNPWHDGAGNLPFLKKLDGSDWAGSRSYSNILNDAPDFRTLNESYWAGADTLLQLLEDNRITVDLFLDYLGYPTTPVQGWNDETVANGPAKMQAYGQLLGNRWKNRKNIRPMVGGDRDTFDAAQIAAIQALINGFKSVPKLCNQYGAEWSRGSISSDQSDFGAETTVQSVYASSTDVVNQCNRGYATGKITYLMEGPYDGTLSSPPVGDANPDATQPIRRHCWRGWQSSRNGYTLGTAGFGVTTGYMALYSTQAVRDAERLNRYIKIHPWWTLAPTTSLVTAGNSAVGSDAYITQMIDGASNARLAILYVPPADSGVFTIDMSLFAGPVRVRRYDPTLPLETGYTTVGTFPASGTQDFTVPGNNAEGTYDDWAYEFDVP